MDCQEAQKHLQDYLDGEAEQDLAGEMELHIESCSSCQAKHEELKAVGNILKAWSPPTPAKDFISRTLEAKKTYVAPRRSRILSFPSWRKLAVAATILLAAGLALWVSISGPNESFQIRILSEVAYLKRMDSLINRLNSIDGLADVTHITNMGTAQSLAGGKLDSSRARTNVAFNGMMAASRNTRDAKLFYKFLVSKRYASTGFPPLMGAAWAQQMPTSRTLSHAAVAEYDFSLDKAAEIYRMNLNKPDIDSMARIRLAFIYLAQGAPEKALDLISMSKSGLAKAERELAQDIERAADMAVRARKMTAYSDEKIGALLTAGDYADAAEELKPLWKQEDDKAFLRGWALCRAGKPEQAIQVLDNLVDRTSENSRVRLLALYETALIREKLGYHKEAGRFFRLAVKAAKQAGDDFFTSAAEIQLVYSLLGSNTPERTKTAIATAEAIVNENARNLALELAGKK